jgi:hypothetical protein
MEFPYTPHVAAILHGRGMFIDGKLMCCATHCIFETEKANFGREIEVKGEANCPNCGFITKYPEDLEFGEHSQRSILTCPACKQKISQSSIKWTQKVVSKHHRGKHLYFHKECHDALYHDVEDEPEGTEEDVGTA